jgi:gas vesicle protein
MKAKIEDERSSIMADNGGTTRSFILGLLAGGAIGAILALLYAPKSGRELRADIKARADELMDDAEQLAEAVRTKLPEISSEAKKRSAQVISEAQSQASSLLEDADRVLSTVKQRAGAVVEEGVKIKEAVKAGVEVFKQERQRS